MKLKNAVENYLRQDIRFRERKNKDKGIVNLLLEMHPVLKAIPREALIVAVQEYATMDRVWRDTLKHNASLRGSDYGEKVGLEQKKMVELGYRPGHLEDIKSLREL